MFHKKNVYQEYANLSNFEMSSLYIPPIHIAAPTSDINMSDHRIVGATTILSLILFYHVIYLHLYFFCRMDSDTEVKLRGLDVKVYQTPTNVLWLELEDICDRIKSEQNGPVKLSDIRRCLTNDRDNVHKQLGLSGTKIPLDCLISFCYRKHSKFTFCRKFKTTIDNLLVKDRPICYINTLDLYKDIAKNGYNTDITDRVPKNFLKDLKPRFLYTYFLSVFSEKDVTKIVLFEWHFANAHPECVDGNSINSFATSGPSMMFTRPAGPSRDAIAQARPGQNRHMGKIRPPKRKQEPVQKKTDE